jgi:hypothetical protein
MTVEPVTPPIRRRWPVKRTITMVVVVGVVGFPGNALVTGVQRARNAAQRSTVL